MKLSEKIFGVLIAGVILLALAGCGNRAAPQSPAPPPAPPASETPAPPAPEPSAPPEAPPAPPASSVSDTPPAPPAPPASSAPAAGDIGLEGAKAAALERMGLSDSQVTWTEAKQDRDHGRLEYELEFWAGQVEYDLDIDGAAGTILKEKWEDHSVSGSADDAGEAAAKAAALGHLGLTESQVSSLRVERDLEHGLVEYEVKFWVGQSEYEYTVTGAGAILEYQLENH